MNHLERLLRKQLIAAVGREITAQDFVEYMDFHNSRRYGSAFQPKTFCYAIRRPDHYPEGIVSIGEMLLKLCVEKRVLTFFFFEELDPPVNRPRARPNSIEECLDAGLCTCVSTGTNYVEQEWFLCRSCFR